MNIITRFAPSPTGFLHIGGARTALFNYLFAKHMGGKFLLRIEDTDVQRSTRQAVDAILSGLKWLELDWDGEIIFQSKRNDLYKQAAVQLLKENRAYYCFTAQADINQMRNIAIENKQPFIFKSPWREADPATYPKHIKPVIRLKAPDQGTTIINDTLQGDVLIENATLDDMVLLRADETATYMLAVVVDDNDMGITNIIRGDDHLTNAARQILLYNAFGWKVPQMTHIPLIHGNDGGKLSKRHGALGIEAYREMGYLPSALCNYLLRLGWSHGDDEIITREKAVALFNLKGLGQSSARLDFAKMNHFNAYYLRNLDETLLLSRVHDLLKQHYQLNVHELDYIKQALPSLKIRSETLNQLADLARIYLVNTPINYSEEIKKIIADNDHVLIKRIITELKNLVSFNKDEIQNLFKEIAKRNNMKLGEVMQPIRGLMTGMAASPSIFEMMQIIGKENTLVRLESYIY